MTDTASPLLGRAGKPQSASEKDAFDTAARFLPGGALGGNALPDDVRFVFSHGDGSRFWDASGNMYIDYILGAGTLVLGHAHPAIQAAVTEQVSRGTHFFAYLNDLSVQLARELVPLIPCAERIRFTTSGSESTFHAIRLARGFTGRAKILKFEGAYHGTHDYAQLSTTPSHTANYPNPMPDTNGIPQAVQELMLVCPYNDLDALKSILDQHGQDIAAIIVEPIQRIISPQAGFLQGVRELTRQHGIVMIMDEVVTGFRYGLSGAQGYFGVVPDMATYGKIIGGGLPVGAVAGRADIMDQADPARRATGDYVYQNGTLQGHPLGCAASLATLSVLREPGVYEALFAYADELRRALQHLFDQHKMGIRVIGDGPMWHLISGDKVPQNWGDILATDLKRQAAFDTELLRQGIFVIPNMRRFVSIRHDKADLALTLEAAERACIAFKAAQ
ncbi:aspartate aminotransferase family protein [Acidisoma silvae]|uniref:Glutamate-1-semialdehyde 2,1-aminomutase n=1 Tax=Acidisoma silvae TaxID=2802396 RepID=A0A963YWC4_9PROT|nr:aminotransferase class III-fold pyridoxal phosphate-dependent enzyme [Acidisoma silvae]MCB8877572.1 aminotransferase class III-fold pyridoxal phosphate-dependent enzyme [Acidisoma silvae]